MDKKIRLLLVEDHEMTRLGLQVGLEKIPELDLVGEAADGIEGLKLANDLLPDVILMDIGLPKIDGIEVTRKVKNANLPSKILMFTSRESQDDVFAALEAGADGYVTKGTNISLLASAIKTVSTGAAWLDPLIARIVLNRATNNTAQMQKNPANFIKETGLTKRELEVLALVADGASNPEIAEKLVITTNTAKAHVHSILQKLCVKNKAQATMLAYNEGII